ncbi:flagellar biosynthesis protein FlgD [Bradyrhizobium sp. U87765 SZCCT0131]|jgi:flagellar basal-body rod modification protein FlgD|uniref:flagellar hook assembly protein FlgD n=1 Tax=unclassified Bradyrhizobium TaxID=2631580 RepID=UPI001BAC632B|nr:MULTISPECIES: flagellar hook capping FlgD N-terminal domain-containing protein [unclassified Bradyrhizobium]MBR1220953.1 flagellar biosynthesis protein FlgD [Bradyrhizobium sp. U87765 SZCCT0131]MBR1260227.1 flagellar biosynthesis protein FlgD [Bradyrhizobium sp. U87765 SZCCT0134]MBR1307524.1 flagellar biosynthesis protein FlgD [Bradyrhizobium sp. U87765 SZCCT0110]MBR1321478.1 flagellar biosynthesis protein FlgD [Bradyrhizobium sp. U87765 SZCCT0109]MBR1349791.1 flagellar biosynthesis protein
MSVSSTAATVPTTSSTATAASVANASSGMTTSSFLSLLVGELQNQDPLDPTSTTDFINQMSQYATFDATQQLDSQLGSMLTSLNSLLTMNSVNYIGHDVIAKGDTTSLQDGTATYGYSLTSAAKSVSLTVQDSSGNVVWSGSGPTASGMNSFTWNGQDSSGKQLTSGSYKLTVTATDNNGNSVYGYTTVTGKVSSVDSSSGTTMLNIGGSTVSVNNIVGVTS